MCKISVLLVYLGNETRTISTYHGGGEYGKVGVYECFFIMKVSNELACHIQSRFGLLLFLLDRDFLYHSEKRSQQSYLNSEA